MFLWTGLFLILSITTVVRGGGSTYITLKSRFNGYDPLVFLVSENNMVYPLPPAKITTYKNNKNEVIFRVPENLQLVLACPAESSDQLLLSNSQKQQLLFEKKFNKNLSCKTPITPFFRALNTDEGDNCGKDEEGVIYVIGYRVRFKSKSKKYANDYGQIVERYINLYEVCYSETKGTMFTIHPLIKTNGYDIEKISQIDFENLNLNSIFKNKGVNELYQNKKSDESIYQFVPYNDMMLTTWKNATLFDINTILVNKGIKKYLDQINDVFHNFTTKISKSLTIYSGVTSSSDSICYWKASKKYIPGGTEEIAILLYDTKSKSVKPQPPCENSEQICQKSGLGEMLGTIPNLFCCRVDESFAKNFGLVIKMNSKVVWGYRDEDSKETYDALAAAPLTTVFVNSSNADGSSDSSEDCGGTGIKCVFVGFGGAGIGWKRGGGGGGGGGRSRSRSSRGWGWGGGTYWGASGGIAGGDGGGGGGGGGDAGGD